jgi:hypothetical protein
MPYYEGGYYPDQYDENGKLIKFKPPMSRKNIARLKKLALVFVILSAIGIIWSTIEIYQSIQKSKMDTERATIKDTIIVK